MARPDPKHCHERGDGHLLADRIGRRSLRRLSAHSGEGVGLLANALHDRLGADLHHCVLRLPAGEGRARARLYEAGAVLGQRPLPDGGIELEVSLRRHDLERICREAGLEVPAGDAPCTVDEPSIECRVRVAAGATA